MAVVGHAHIVVRAITDKVQGDIERGFRGASNSSNKAGKDMGDSFSKGLGASLRKNTSLGEFANELARLNPDALAAAESFTKLVRKGYLVQAALGAVVGGIGAIVGGLGALIGAAGGAAASLVAVGGAVITLGVGVKIASFAMKGISQAVSQATQANGGYSKSLKQMKFDLEEAALSITRAELNLEKAREGLARVADLAPNNRLRREAELAVREAELALRKAKDAEKNPDTAGTDPFAGLTPAQKQFAQFLAGLKPKLDALREAAAKGFLPLLEEQITKLINGGLFEVLERRFFDIAQGAGKAVENFTDIFLAGDNLNDFDKVLGNIAETLPKLGTVFGNAFGSFLSILEAADPVTRKFVGFLESKSGQFSRFLDTKQATGDLTTFFNQAGVLGGMFSKVFGNIFSGFGALIRANFGPGSGGFVLLEYLDKATAGFKSLDSIGMENYFKGAAENFMAIGDSLGILINTIVDQGSNPAVKEFFDNLNMGAGAFDTIIINAVNSAPALGDLMRVLTEIGALLSDSKTVTTFFETLTFFASGAREILEDLKPLLDIAGPFFAAYSAIMLVKGTMTLLALVMRGFLINTIAGLGAVAGLFGMTLPAAMTKHVVATKGATVAMTAFNMTNPVGWITLTVAAIATLAMALNGIKGSQVDKAMKEVTKGFETGASAADIYRSATLSTDDLTKNLIDSNKEMKEGLDSISGGFMDTTYKSVLVGESFGAIGTSLNNMAVTDLPAAQKQFEKLSAGLGLNRRQAMAALDSMGDYKKTIIAQAEAMGISLTNTKGQIEQTKLLDFALGQGEVKTRAAEAAQRALNETIGAAASKFIDLSGNLNQNAADVKKWAEGQAKESIAAGDSWEDFAKKGEFSLEFFSEELNKQYEAALVYRDNMTELAKLVPKAFFDQILAQGPAGAKLVAQLLEADPATRAKIVFQSTELARLSATTYAGEFKATVNKIGVSGFTPTGFSIFPKTQNNAPKNKNGGYVGGFAMGGFVSGAGTARSDSIPAMLSNGEFVINSRATANNRQLLEAINSNASVSTAPTINLTVNPSPGMDEKALATEVSRQLAFQIRRGGA